MIRGIAPQAPLLFSLKDLMRLLRGKGSHQMEEEVKHAFPDRQAFFLSSGRACLYFLLKSLAKREGGKRTRVIVPAYTCPTVPYTIWKAGLETVLCDVDEKFFSFDEEQLQGLMDERVLAVIPTHLFGIPCLVEPVKKEADSRGAYVIEDFSHAVGADIKGTPVGLETPFSFTSLGRGKMLTTRQGGLLLLDSPETAEDIEEETQHLKKTPKNRNGWILMNLAIFHFLIAGRRWGLVLSSRWDPEKKEPNTAFKPSRPNAFQAAILAESLGRAESFQKERIKRADILRWELKGLENIHLPTGAPRSHPVHMMFPLVFKDEALLDRVFESLRREGFSPSRMYKHALSRMEDVIFANRGDGFPQAESWSERLMTLPSHPYVPKDALLKMADIVRKEVGGRS
ncbi:MAG: DegT/DnrJ/EryC1/StrS family aminotransferase [Candidatus Aminicenantes bacterium]|nr:DegT/DnrJ/EryC1/StrS family aminotransferase [Candidatus Aminicenantes bacterium]